MVVELALLIGITFGVLASLTASLIVYDEYRKHGLTRRQLRDEVLRTAAFAFLAFLALSIVAGYWHPLFGALKGEAYLEHSLNGAAWKQRPF